MWIISEGERALEIWCGWLLWRNFLTQTVKNLPVMQETQVQSLGWEDSLEKGMATYSSILAWENPMDRGAWWATVHGSQRVRHDWANSAFTTSFSGLNRVQIQTQVSWLQILILKQVDLGELIDFSHKSLGFILYFLLLAQEFSTRNAQTQYFSGSFFFTIYWFIFKNWKLNVKSILR